MVKSEILLASECKKKWGKMKNSEEDPGSKYFDSGVTDRERAIFEGAITLGALYHQFVGTPIRDQAALEKAIEESALAHPFIKGAKAKVDDSEGRGDSPYQYPELSGKGLMIELESEYNGSRAELGMRRVKELDYPLMYIKEIRE